MTEAPQRKTVTNKVHDRSPLEPSSLRPYFILPCNIYYYAETAHEIEGPKTKNNSTHCYQSQDTAKPHV